MTRPSSAAATSDQAAAPPDLAPGGNARPVLAALVERIERLHEERKALSDDVADVYREAKGNGFDTRALREVIRLRAKDPEERRAHSALVDAYMSALGSAP